MTPGSANVVLPSTERPQQKNRGWIVVGFAFLILSLVGGLTFYSMSVYISALVTERGFTLQVASVCPTMSAAFGGIGGILTARLMKTVPTRWLMAVGGIGLGASMVFIGSSQSVWQLWLAFALSGLFGSMTSIIPVTALVARWFPLAPARPLTIAMTGLAVGGAIIPPIVLQILSVFGLALGSAILGVAIVVVVGSSLPFVREPVHVAVTATSPLAVPRFERPRLREKKFVYLFVGMTLLFLSQVATAAHLVILSEELYSGGAALAVTILALGSLSGRLLGIPLLPALGLRRLALGVGLLQAGGQVMLGVSHAQVWLYVGTFLLGLAMGNVSILQSLFAIEAYGLAVYPWVLSRLNLADPIGAGVGPLIVGLMHGWLGGYQWPLVTMGLLSAVGAAALFLSRIDSNRYSDKT